MNCLLYQTFGGNRRPRPARQKTPKHAKTRQNTPGDRQPPPEGRRLDAADRQDKPIDRQSMPGERPPSPRLRWAGPPTPSHQWAGPRSGSGRTQASCTPCGVRRGASLFPLRGKSGEAGKGAFLAKSSRWRPPSTYAKASVDRPPLRGPVVRSAPSTPGGGGETHPGGRAAWRFKALSTALAAPATSWLLGSLAVKKPPQATNAPCGSRRRSR